PPQDSANWPSAPRANSIKASPTQTARAFCSFIVFVLDLDSSILIPGAGAEDGGPPWRWQERQSGRRREVPDADRRDGQRLLAADLLALQGDKGRGFSSVAPPARKGERCDSQLPQVTK